MPYIAKIKKFFKIYIKLSIKYLTNRGGCGVEWGLVANSGKIGGNALAYKPMYKS